MSYKGRKRGIGKRKTFGSRIGERRKRRRRLAPNQEGEPLCDLSLKLKKEGKKNERILRTLGEECGEFCIHVGNQMQAENSGPLEMLLVRTSESHSFID